MVSSGVTIFAVIMAINIVFVIVLRGERNVSIIIFLSCYDTIFIHSIINYSES